MIKIRNSFDVGPYDAAQSINRVSKSPILITETSALSGTGFEVYITTGLIMGVRM